MQKNIVILISGGGSNMAAITETARRDCWKQVLAADVTAVISNRPHAGGLVFAQEKGLHTDVIDHTLYPSRATFEEDLRQAIDRHQPALVVLAGFMRVLTPASVQHYRGRLLNIHPSLLPAFPGLHTHQRALDAGCRFAGATVHEVTAELDAGSIIDQAVVPVLQGNTADTLAARVLTQEHLLYPRAIRRFLSRLPEASTG